MDLRRIRELTDAFEASDWDEIDLEIDGVRIQLSTAAAPPSPAGSNECGVRADDANERHSRDAGGGHAAEVAAPPAANERDTGADDANEGHTRSAEAGAGPAGDGGPADVPAQVPPGADGTPVAAPSPGIFWRAPSPGEPPFVEVGDRVEADTVVCIVELMKLMNRVVAGVSGTVTAVLADNRRGPAERRGPGGRVPAVTRADRALDRPGRGRRPL